MFKSKKCKVLLELVAVIAAWSYITFMAYAVGNYTAPFSAVNISASSTDGNGTYTTSGNGFTVSVEPSKNTSGCNTTYSEKKSSVTLTNKNSYRSLLNYTIAANSTNKGTVIPAIGTYSVELDPNSVQTIEFTSGSSADANANYIVTINSNNVIQVTPTAATADASMGAASVSPSGSVDPGTRVTFTATALDGFQFDYWKNASGTKVSTENPYTITVTGNTALTAVFKPLATEVDISVSILSDSYGTVVLDDSTTFSGLGGKQTVSANSTHTLTAAENTGYVFAGWMEGYYTDLVTAYLNGTPDTSSGETKSVTAGYNDLPYTAVFLRKNTYAVSVNDSSMGSATVKVGSGTASSSSVTGVLTQTVTYTASANTGCVFEGWYAGTQRVSTDETYSFTVSSEGDLSLVAKFRDPQLSLALGPGLSSIDVNIGGTTQTITDAETFSIPSGSSVTVMGHVATGYTFYQWQSGTSSASTSASYTFTVSDDVDLTAFCKDSGDTVAGVCKNVSTGTIYATVEEGMAAARNGQTVVLIADATVTQSFTIESGRTLLIPYGTETSADYSYQETNSINMGNVKYTLTVPQNVIVDVRGTLCVNAMQGTASTQRSGNIAGDYGKMLLDGELNVSGTLRAYGIISGSGSITAQSGASVYQFLEMTDYRGGQQASDIYKNMFPINQFYIQNIQVSTTYKYESKLYGHWYIYVPTLNIGEFTGTEMLVGPSTESRVFFKVDSGDVVWHYNASKAKTIVEIYGNAAVSSLEITVSALALIIDMDSKKVECPLSGAFDITVKNGATVTMANKFKILPGGAVTVEDGGNLIISSSLYLYDVADYQAATWNYGGYRTKPKTAGGGSITETEDGQLIVNGTMTVTSTGEVYSSSSADSESSSIRTTANTGKIVFQGAQGGSTSIYECVDNKTASQVGAFDSARGKFAETGTWEKFSDRATYYSNGESWYRYKITYYNNGEVVGYDYTTGGDITKELSAFTNPSASVSGGTATASVSGSTLTLSDIGSDVSVNITGTINTYVPTFVLNETQYANYQTFTGNTLAETATINGATYYVVMTRDEAAFGSVTVAPTDVVMGITTANANSIAWYLSDSKDGTEFMGTVPEGENAGGPVYIYGIYTGAVAYNSYTGKLYTTLAEALDELPGSGNVTITMVNNCGAYVPEDATTVYPVNSAGKVILDLNGFTAVGRIDNSSNLTIDLNGGTLDYHTGATAASTPHRTLAAAINTGTLTVKDTVGGGKITTDLASDSSGANSSACIRNNGGTMSVSGVTLEMTQLLNNYGAAVMNYNGGTITSLSNVTINSGRNYTVFNYGGTINTISDCTMTGGYGINNRNLRGSNAIADGYNISQYGVIGTIENTTVTVGRYAIYNGGKITTLSGCTFTAHPDSAQVDTLGNGSAAADGNVQSYTVYNSPNWWYDTGVWKRVDDSTALTRTDTYQAGESYLPTITTITDCKIYAENTSTSTDHGYALYNAGVIGTIGGTTEIKSYPHPSNGKITTSNYALQNAGGGIIKSIAGSVNVSATNHAIRNIGQFATQIVYTYDNKIGGNVTQQVSTYSNPSKIESISGGTFTATSGYALANYGYIPSITGGTFKANNNIISNMSDTASTSYTLIRRYSYNATAATKYYEQETYIRNNEYGSRIDSISGVTITTTGTNGYYAIANNGYIGTISGFTISSDSTRDALDTALILNGDARQSKYVVTSESTQSTSGGYVMPRRWHYEYTPAVIDLIDKVSFIKTSKGYAFDNRGQINTLQNSTIQATQYALYNDYRGPYTTRDQLRYYSGAAVYATTRNNGSTIETNRTRAVANIDTISDCIITTTSGAYALYNAGNIGTLTQNTITAKTTDAVYNGNINNNQELSYTYNVEEIATYDDDGTDFTFAFNTAAGAKEEVYVYGVPTIGTIGAGNTITATTDKAIENLGRITEISGEGLTITASDGIGILNQTGIRENRTINRTVTETGANSVTTSNVWSTVDPAAIGTIGCAVITATNYGIQNGTNNSTYSPVTITTMGEGTEVKSTSADAVYNYGTYAQIGTITGGIYTASASSKYAFNNVGTAYATAISDGNFKGGTNEDETLGRAYAIFEPNNTDRQTYPEGLSLTASGTTRSVTLADGTTVRGYYYIGLANPGTETVTGETTTDRGDRVGYATLAEAIAAYEAMPDEAREKTYITLVNTTTETGNIKINQDLYLDLNGYTVTLNDHSLNLNGHKLYGMDSRTNSYLASGETPGQIIGTIEGTVSVICTNTGIGANGNKSYVTVTSTDENSPTATEFHRFAITPIACRFYLNNDQEKNTSHAHLEVKAAVQGDDTVIGEIQDLGFAISSSDGNATVDWMGEKPDFGDGIDADTGTRTVSFIALTCDVTAEEMEDGSAKAHYEAVHTITAMAAFDAKKEQLIKSGEHKISLYQVLEQYAAANKNAEDVVTKQNAERVRIFLGSLTSTAQGE